MSNWCAYCICATIYPTVRYMPRYMPRSCHDICHDICTIYARYLCTIYARYMRSRQNHDQCDTVLIVTRGPGHSVFYIAKQLPPQVKPMPFCDAKVTEFASLLKSFATSFTMAYLQTCLAIKLFSPATPTSRTARPPRARPPAGTLFARATPGYACKEKPGLFV